MPGEARGERVESPGQEAAAHSPRSGVMFERAADQEIGGLKRCRLTVSSIRGGMDGGVAFVPAVPGLAPRGFYGGEGGVARVIEPASQASAGRMPKRSLRGVSEGRMPERTSGEMARATPTHSKRLHQVLLQRPCKQPRGRMPKRGLHGVSGGWGRGVAFKTSRRGRRREPRGRPGPRPARRRRRRRTRPAARGGRDRSGRGSLLATGIHAG